MFCLCTVLAHCLKVQHVYNTLLRELFNFVRKGIHCLDTSICFQLIMWTVVCSKMEIAKFKFSKLLLHVNMLTEVSRPGSILAGDTRKYCDLSLKVALHKQSRQLQMYKCVDKPWKALLTPKANIFTAYIFINQHTCFVFTSCQFRDVKEQQFSECCMTDWV